MCLAVCVRINLVTRQHALRTLLIAKPDIAALTKRSVSDGTKALKILVLEGLRQLCFL